IVGQQATRGADSGAAVDERIDLFAARAAAGECDLVAKGVVNGEARGWRRVASGRFRSDRAGERPIPLSELRAAGETPGSQVGFLCAPPGSGRRIGVDRDMDGAADRDEVDAGSDPADAGSRPGDVVPVGMPTSLLEMADENSSLLDVPPTPALRSIRFAAREATASSPGAIRVPAPGSADDPRRAGATVTVYASGSSPGRRDRTSLVLRPSDWRLVGTEEAPRGYRFVSTDPSFPIRSALLRAGSFRFEGGGAAWGYSLDEPSQGRVAVRVAVGATLRLCADAGPAPAGTSPALTDGPGSFRADRGQPAPPACPSL
ncbi:hypothetical protein KGQ64_12670, partial [bacterium]|nr:hypothetical protein [bacterium]